MVGQQEVVAQAQDGCKAFGPPSVLSGALAIFLVPPHTHHLSASVQLWGLQA